MRLEVELPDGAQTLVLGKDEVGKRLSEVLRSKNMPLNTRCGEKNMCAGCLLEIVEGELIHVSNGETVSSGEVRGCQFRPASEFVRVRIPQRSRLSYAPQVLDSYRVNVPLAKDPMISTGLGVAIDIGTTTVVVQVLEPEMGEIVGRASGFNRQMLYGDDVLTRINLCSTSTEMLGKLQEAIIKETIMPLLFEALGEAPIGEVRCFSVAGNTTMLHLLVGADPSPMGFAPFTPQFVERDPFPASQIGLHPDDATVVLLPSITAYIGADLTAGLFASGLFYEEGPSLLVDVGTNGEILLKHDGVVTGCATAAGPAFEGSGLNCGIRAGAGAISHLWIEGDPLSVRCERIGEGKPTGVCGSGYVDFLAEGRRSGLLSAAGRFQRFDTDVVVETPNGRAVRLAYGQGKRPIVITESDVGRLLQAKAAVAAGILTLLNRYKLRPQDVQTLYLAGGFGMHVDIENAIACGLLPCFQREQIELVGNTSLAGATFVLLDRNTLAELSRSRQGVEVVELNLEPSFEDTYIDQLMLP
jgi:uncharacterized 2Fe-2S/4Fe-4S cluster protein (DUF4445 family)